MTKFSRVAIGIVAALSVGLSARAVESTWIYAVQATAAVSTDPARIELNWPADHIPAHRYTVQRKLPSEAVWGEAVTLGGDATRFTDENVEVGKTYEYQIIKHADNRTAYGYIAAGLNAPLIENRGRVLLLVDDTFAGPLANEIARLQRDLAGDGWTVVRHDVSRSASPTDVRGLIRQEYTADRERTRAVFLLGRLPILRSGNLNIDGHGARPMPADVFYGDVDGEWTDANGDGIYDQSTVPSAVELQVGRVDFAELPGRQSPIPYPSEVEMMKRYLDKNHAYRHAAVRPRHRALVGNVIGDANGQATAASGYRNFSALVGPTNVTTANSEPNAPVEDRWISLLAKNDYLWVFGCGGGGDTSIGGLGLHPPYFDAWSSDFLEQKAKGTFYLGFGSWFGDWSKPDNLLRTALAAPDYGLTAAWSGRPHLYFHHMGSGETIGYGIRLSQNNRDTYQNQVQRQIGGVHIALLGDPTLRMHQVAPPTEVRAAVTGNEVTLTWKAPEETVIGYFVYRGPNANGPFTRISPDIVSATRFVDGNRSSDATTYLVRAVTLTSGPSGSFWNASQGVVATADATAALAATPEASWTDATKATDLVWVDDALPADAQGHAENDQWDWIRTNPAPFSGANAHQADAAQGRHHHFFTSASAPLAINSGDTLFAYVYLDPANPPRQLMLTWLADNWEHRAYWGENLIDEGVDGTASRRRIGTLPPLGQWVRLELPASSVGLEGQAATGMGFTLFDGRATWDRAGKSR